MTKREQAKLLKMVKQMEKEGVFERIEKQEKEADKIIKEKYS